MRVHDLKDILDSLLEQPKVASTCGQNIILSLLISRLQNFFLVCEEDQMLRLYPSHQSMPGIGTIDIHVKDRFKNFEIEVSHFDIAPAEGFKIDDLLPKDSEFNDHFTFDRYKDSDGIEKLKVSLA